MYNPSFGLSMRTISTFYSGASSTLSSFALKTTQVITGIIKGVLPHSLFMASILTPSYLIAPTKYLSKITLFIGLWNTGSIAFKVSRVAGIILFLSNELDLIPLRESYRVSADILMILNSAYIGFCSIRECQKKFHLARHSTEDNLTEKISNFVSGTLLLTTGGLTLGMTCHDAIRYYHGYQVFSTLDSPEKISAIRHRSISLLSGEKTCHAVVVEDQRIRPGNYIKALYENCHVRIYNASSSEQFCEALRDAHTHFENKIDILNLDGHGSSTGLTLGNDYRFVGSPIESECIKEYTSPDAQVLLMSCNSADSSRNREEIFKVEEAIAKHDQYQNVDRLKTYLKSLKEHLHITQRLSRSLPGRTVIGFTDSFSPVFLEVFFSESKLTISYDDPFLPAQAVTYKDGELL